eukprot:jgi/Botrbrau1/5856/Bobra.0366s0037.1
MEKSPTAREQINLTCTIVNSIDKIDQKEWDACATGSGEVNPFVLWSFLHALEASRSAVKEEGWLPTHVTIREARSGALLGCCPLYLKSHSYGEYVFDHGWASAASRFGLMYYPKLQSCVPFSPVTGPRLLVNAPGLTSEVTRALIQMLKTVADNMGVAGVHMTFNTAEEWEAMAQQGFLQRRGIQYHWENRSYQSFDHFLQDLKQSKRKNIRQERKKVAAEGLVIERLTGEDVKNAELWDRFYTFYRNTTDQKWGQAYINPRTSSRLLGETDVQNKVMLVGGLDEGPKRSPGGPEPLNLIGSHHPVWAQLGQLLWAREVKQPCTSTPPVTKQALGGGNRAEPGKSGGGGSRRAQDPARSLSARSCKIDYTMEALRLGASPFKSTSDSSDDSLSLDSFSGTLDVY